MAGKAPSWPQSISKTGTGVGTTALRTTAYSPASGSDSDQAADLFPNHCQDPLAAGQWNHSQVLENNQFDRSRASQAPQSRDLIALRRTAPSQAPSQDKVEAEARQHFPSFSSTHGLPFYRSMSPSSGATIFSNLPSPTPATAQRRGLPMLNVHEGLPFAFREKIPRYGNADGYVSFRVVHDTTDRAPPPADSRPRQIIRRGIRRQDDQTFSIQLTPYDQRGLRFYLNCWATKRTLKNTYNFWEREMLHVSQSDPGTATAICAFGLCYLMDYWTSWDAYCRLLELYSAAETYLVHQLNNPETWHKGQERAMLATGILLISCDNTQWEDRWQYKRRDCPRWLELARRLKHVLDETDSHRGSKDKTLIHWPEYKVGFGNWLAMGLLASDALTPLSTHKVIEYEWLTYGRLQDRNKIHGSVGLCPDLLHVFSLVSAYTAQMSQYRESFFEDPPTIVKSKLEGICQYSEEFGYRPIGEMLRSCEGRSAHDLSRDEVVELSAAAWYLAAQVYSNCRLSRLLPGHTMVAQQLNQLRAVISILPTSGRHFTSQAPLFPIFLLGMLSSEPDRFVAKKWFEDVVVKSKCRSSVPPLWTALQGIWDWMDEHMPLYEAGFIEGLPIPKREAWWEELVAHILAESGYLCLY